jgi:hypothetical protein
LDDIAVEQQAPAADELGFPSECDQADSYQGACPSHLSTRSVMRGDGVLYVVIKQQRVSMRMSDHCLNATAICNAAGLSKPERDKQYFPYVFGG